jgi:hypothetical protein
VHCKREPGRAVSYKVVKGLMKDAAAAFAPAGRTECLARRAAEAAAKWQGRHPGGRRDVRGRLRGLPGRAVGAGEPPAAAGASTNLLGNLMRRLRRRTAVVCVFPNRASCDRLVGAQLLEVHEQWQAEPRAYPNVEQRPAAAAAVTACAV